MAEEKQNVNEWKEKTGKKIEEKLAEKKEEETKTEEKKEEKKVEERKKGKEEKARKTEAIVYGKDLPISTKHSIALCNFIKGKRVEEAILLLKEVLRMKKAVPMKGELPHRKGKIMSGRYPINATKQFIKLLKQLTANAIINGLDVKEGKIECKADRASRPYKRFGSERFKRTHVTLKLKEKEELIAKEEKEKNKNGTKRT